MTSIRRFTCSDLFTFNAVNLDYFTETVLLRSRLCAAKRGWLSLEMTLGLAPAVQPALLPAVLGQVARILPVGLRAWP